MFYLPIPTNTINMYLVWGWYLSHCTHWQKLHTVFNLYAAKLSKTANRILGLAGRIIGPNIVTNCSIFDCLAEHLWRFSMDMECTTPAILLPQIWLEYAGSEPPQPPGAGWSNISVQLLAGVQPWWLVSWQSTSVLWGWWHHTRWTYHWHQRSW